MCISMTGSGRWFKGRARRQIWNPDCCSDDPAHRLWCEMPPRCHQSKCCSCAIQGSWTLLCPKDRTFMQTQRAAGKSAVSLSDICIVWLLGCRNWWEGPGGDPGLQDMSAGEGHHRCLQTRYAHLHTYAHWHYMAVSPVLKKSEMETRWLLLLQTQTCCSKLLLKKIRKKKHHFVMTESPSCDFG